jgi:hypothetical protein
MAPARVITISSGPDRNAPIQASDAHHQNEWYNQDFDGYRITEQPLLQNSPYMPKDTSVWSVLVLELEGCRSRTRLNACSRMLSFKSMRRTMILVERGWRTGTQAALATFQVIVISSHGRKIQIGVTSTRPLRKYGDTSSTCRRSMTWRNTSSSTPKFNLQHGMKMLGSGGSF